MTKSLCQTSFKQSVDAVLFDLDGTLVDTAPDLVEALNLAMLQFGFETVPLDKLRHVASHGSLALIKAALPSVSDNSLPLIQQALLAHYAQVNGNNARLFDGLDEFLNHLDRLHIPFGIVTNKPARYTRPLIDALGLTSRMATIISGDSTAYAKPATAPMLLAAQQLGAMPKRILYLGDAKRDLIAADKANMIGATALWGYIGPEDTPEYWPAKVQFKTVKQLNAWLVADPLY